MTAPWRDREPFGPLVYRSSRGVLHRARSGPRLHERCRAGKPLIGSVISDSEAVAWATGHPAVLCRYPWCFRETVRAAGLDPEVGHAKRAVHRRRERPARRERHRPTPVEAHDHTPGWWWCSCGRIVIRATDMHNPHRSWWAHKATGYRTPQMTRVRVNVTQRDIERGLPTHPHRCPIARAIKRAVPADADRIHVGWEVVDIGDDTVDLPLPVIVFINDFDRHHPVEPFTFTLEVPE